MIYDSFYVGVKEWLVQNAMESYAAALNSMGVADLSALSKLEASDMASLGLAKGKEKKRVLACISKLKEQLASPTVTLAAESLTPDVNKRSSDPQGPPRSKSRKHVAVSAPVDPMTTSMEAGESTESSVSEVAPKRATSPEDAPAARHGQSSRQATAYPSPSVTLAKSEASQSEAGHVGSQPSPGDAHDEKLMPSAPHLFHTDDGSRLDSTKEYGRSEEDTEIRSSNSVDRDHRHSIINEPEPESAAPASRSKKSKRSLHAASAATSAVDAAQATSGTTSTNPTTTTATAATGATTTTSSTTTNKEAPATNGSNALPTSSPSPAPSNGTTASGTASTATSGTVAPSQGSRTGSKTFTTHSGGEKDKQPTNSSPAPNDTPASAASTSTAPSGLPSSSSSSHLASPSGTSSRHLEGQLQVKKGGFFRRTKKWEPRWCTFEGRVFEAFKTKDDKVPVFHVDITKAIVVGSNDRNLKVLELTAHGKKSYWTSPNIDAWIKVMRSMSITSLNAKRRTADYTGFPEAEAAARAQLSSGIGLGIDSSGEVYQSLDVATEEEDRGADPEDLLDMNIPVSIQGPETTGARRGHRNKTRKPRKTVVADGKDSPNSDFQSSPSPPPAPTSGSHARGPASPLSSSADHILAKDSPRLDDSPTTSSGDSAENGHTHLGPSISSPATPVPNMAASAASNDGLAPPPQKASKKRSSEALPVTIAVVEDPKSSTSKGRRHHDRPNPPKKTSSVGNLSTAKLHDDIFTPATTQNHHATQRRGTGASSSRTVFAKKGRPYFSEYAPKDAVVRYATLLKARRRAATASPASTASTNSTAPPHSPRGSAGAKDAPTLIASLNSSANISTYSFMDEESEFEDPYYDDEILQDPATGSAESSASNGFASPAELREIQASSVPNLPIHMKRPQLAATFQVVVPRSSSDKSRWAVRFCTFNGHWLRAYSNANDAKANAKTSGLVSSFDILHCKVTPIYISRVMCLDIHDEDSGRREFWRGIEVSIWLPHLERYAGRGYDPILGGLLVRQCHRDESQWVARYCTFNGHQFQSYRYQGDSHPIWTSHTRHLSTRPVKQGGGVELMELVLDGGAQSLWWEPPTNLVSGVVKPLPSVKRFNLTVGSGAATTSGGDTPTLASVLRAAPLDVPENRRIESIARDDFAGREDDEDEVKTLKTRMTDWIHVIREAHEIAVGDSERYIPDEWEPDSDEEEVKGTKKSSKSSTGGAGTAEVAMKGVLEYKVAKKSWEPRFVEIVGRYLHVSKKKHDKKPELTLKLNKCRSALKRGSDAGKYTDTLELTNDERTYVFRGKSIVHWNDAMVSFGAGQNPSGAVMSLPLNLGTIDPIELSAAESRSESAITSGRWGALEGSETEQDLGRSEDPARREEPTPPTRRASSATFVVKEVQVPNIPLHVPVLGTIPADDSLEASEHGSTDVTNEGADSSTSKKSTHRDDGTGSYAATTTSVDIGEDTARGGGGGSGEGDGHVTALSQSGLSTALSASHLKDSPTAVTTDDSSSGQARPRRTASVSKTGNYKSPEAALESVKLNSVDPMAHPTSYYSDADDNQFAPTTENMPKPAWTGSIARYRQEADNWVGRYIILRPGVDILVYLSKPSSIDSVPPLSTIDVANLQSVVLSTIPRPSDASFPVIELTDGKGKKHVWYTSEASSLTALIEASRARTGPKKRASKRQIAPTSPGTSKRAHKPHTFSNMSGSSGALEVPGKHAPAAEAVKEKPAKTPKVTDAKP